MCCKYDRMCVLVSAFLVIGVCGGQGERDGEGGGRWREREEEREGGRGERKGRERERERERVTETQRKRERGGGGGGQAKATTSAVHVSTVHQHSNATYHCQHIKTAQESVCAHACMHACTYCTGSPSGCQLSSETKESESYSLKITEMTHTTRRVT